MTLTQQKVTFECPRGELETQLAQFRVQPSISEAVFATAAALEGVGEYDPIEVSVNAKGNTLGVSVARVGA